MGRLSLWEEREGHGVAGKGEKGGEGRGRGREESNSI